LGLEVIKLFLKISKKFRNYLFEMLKIKEITWERKLQKIDEN
jgi:hypothetical protein